MAGRLAIEKAAEAFDTVVDFLQSFESLDDPRQRAKVLYPLDEVLLLVSVRRWWQGLTASSQCRGVVRLSAVA